jgi:hypothetical protein
LNKELEKQFAIYKNKKLEIDNCSSFDEYSELKRADKKLIIDYHEISEYSFNEYKYNLILIYLLRKDTTPIVKVNIKMYKKFKIKMYNFYIDSEVSDSIFILSFNR